MDIKKKLTIVSAILMVATLVNLAFAPTVNAYSTGQTSAELIGKAVIVDDPKIVVFENTRTSTVVQIDDVLITQKSDEGHTKAVMEIEDLKTGQKEVVNYDVTKKDSKYTTRIYYKGVLANTLVTEYDPLEPGVTKGVLKDNALKAESDSMASIASYSYSWDGVSFVSGSGVKYPHPDYAYGEPWEEYQIYGNQLLHYHIADWESEIIVALGPVAAGAAIGAKAGVVGAVVGAVLGLVMGAMGANTLLDEEDCIWFWFSHSWEYVVIPIHPYWTLMPKYFRISPYTLWDNIGMGSP